MQIFVEHWGIICNFTPIWPYFQHWGRMNLNHDFVQVSKLSEDQKWKSFSPDFEWKRFFPISFFPDFEWTPTLKCTSESNYWGNADVDHTQTIGRIQSNYWGGYISLGFGTPALNANIVAFSYQPSELIFRQITI